MTHEYTSPEMASLASRAMRDPASLDLSEIRRLGACVLTQTRNRTVEETKAALAEMVEAEQPSEDPSVAAERKTLMARIREFLLLG